MDTPTSTPDPVAEPRAAVPATMKGIYYENYGPAEVLRYGDLPTPSVGAGQIRIRVIAASVNPIDWRLRSGEMRYVLPGGFPRVPGYDVAGYVHDGGDAGGLSRGTRVMGLLDSVFGGGYAEWAVCSVRGIAVIPGPMSFEEAAGLPLAGSTALQSLRDHGRIRTGDRVLINGASGAVGGFAVQIAKAYGAHVTGVASGESEDYVRSLGADDFLNYHTTDFTQAKRNWALIFDAAGKSSFRRARHVLEKNGRYVSTEPSVSGLVTSIATLATARRGRVMLARARSEDLEELIRLYSVDQLRVTVDDILPLQEAADAQRRSESGNARGKIVLRTGVPI